MRLIAILFASSAFALGCSGGTASRAHVGSIRGRVVAGPTTPVFRPDDPACADRPVAGAVLRLEPLDGRPAETLVSDSEGHFRKSVPPGRYRLVPQPVKGLVGTAAPIEVTLLEGAEVDVTFSYDTGIR
jgi:hypothetical protein